jgi:CBS-domain-containing membrane protein
MGAFAGIALIYFIMLELALPSNSLALLAASTGATALLIFALPDSEFSQPWSVLGGHTLSGLVGVTCFQLLDNNFLSSALSVSLAIFVMHALKCLHPPGGATALLAVIGGEPITSLGFSYLLFPVLSNVLVLILIAGIFNYLLIPALQSCFRRQPVNEEDSDL